MLAQGFEIHDTLFAPAELGRILAELEIAPNRSRAGARHLMGQKAIADLARDDRLLGLARSALGAEALPFRATLFSKSARANWLVVWHQDTALPLRFRRDLPGWGPWSKKAGAFTPTHPRKLWPKSWPSVCSSTRRPAITVPSGCCQERTASES